MPTQGLFFSSPKRDGSLVIVLRKLPECVIEMFVEVT
jgi:hypothetical protein